MKQILQKGSSTLEILIAFSILALCMTAVVIVGFGNQAVSIDSQTNIEGLSYAQEMLEDARVQADVNFLSVVSKTKTVTFGIPYVQTLAVADITECKKQATSTVTWLSGTRPQKIELATLLTDTIGLFALGGDCAFELPLGGWTNPGSLLSRDFQKKVGDDPGVNSSAGIPASDIDILDKRIYMTALESSKDNFYVFDASGVLSKTVPPIIGSFNAGPGLNRVDVAGNYAYVANASTTSTQSSDEFMVIDVSTPSAPSVVASIDLGIVPNCPTFCPGGAQAIYYFDGRVYVGTHRIGGEEFYVFSVSAPHSPTSPQLLGKKEINHNVSDIVVRGNYAYLATSADTEEVIVLDVSNPTVSIPQVGAFEAKDTDGTLSDQNATTLFLIGNKLYLGRDKVNKNADTQRDFYVIDVSNPALPVSLGSANLQYITGKNFSANVWVTGIYVVGRYGFIATNDSDPGFIVLDINNPAALNYIKTSPLSKIISTFNYANYNTGIDFDEGFIFTSNSQNDALRIIRPAQCADKVDDDGDGAIDAADPQCHSDGNPSNNASYNPEDDSE